MKKSQADDPTNRLGYKLAQRGIHPRHLLILSRNDAAVDAIATLVRELLIANRAQTRPTEPISFEDIPISEGKFSKRVKNTLELRGVKSVHSLTLLTREFVATFSGFGPVTMQEIEETLREYGLSFRDELTEGIADKAARIEQRSEHLKKFLSQTQQ